MTTEQNATDDVPTATSAEEGTELTGASAERRTSSRRVLALAVALVLMVLAAGVQYQRTGVGAEQKTCKMPGVVNQPVADSPNAAFLAWHSSGGADVWAARLGRPTPRASDFRQTSASAWEWRVRVDGGGESGIAVGVSEVPGGYAVTQAVPCAWTRG